MATARPKRPRDTNQLAWQIVQEATGQAEKQSPVALPKPHRNAPAAVLGGQARARALPVATRRLIAKKAANARWKKR